MMVDAEPTDGSPKPGDGSCQPGGLPERVQIPCSREVGGRVFYIVECTSSGGSGWSCAKRYSHFTELRSLVIHDMKTEEVSTVVPGPLQLLHCAVSNFLYDTSCMTRYRVLMLVTIRICPGAYKMESSCRAELRKLAFPKKTLSKKGGSKAVNKRTPGLATWLSATLRMAAQSRVSTAALQLLYT